MNIRSKPVIQVAAMSAKTAVEHLLQKLEPPEFEWRVVDKFSNLYRPGFVFWVADCPKYASVFSGTDRVNFIVLDAEHPHPHPFVRIEGCDPRRPTQICKSCHKVMYSCYERGFNGDLWRARLCVECFDQHQPAGL